MAKAKQQYVITHPMKKNDSEDKLVAFVSLNKQLSDVQSHLKELMSLPGVDAMQAVSRYTFQIVIAPSFDVEEVWTEIKATLEVMTAGVVIVGAFKK